jgi:hypothetical protein
MQEGVEATGQLVIARGKATKLLESVEESLDKAAMRCLAVSSFHLRFPTRVPSRQLKKTRPSGRVLGIARYAVKFCSLS